MCGESMRPEQPMHSNDVDKVAARHKMLSDFAANNSNLNRADILFNITYGTGEHIEVPEKILTVNGITEAKETINKHEGDGLLVFLYSEPPMGINYEITNKDNLYMLVDESDGVTYAVAKNKALLQKFLNQQAA
jgi:hypothetical protein